MLPTLKAEISDVPSMGKSSQPVGVFSQSSKVRPVFNPSGLSCFIKGSLLLSVRPFDSIIQGGIKLFFSSGARFQPIYFLNREFPCKGLASILEV